MPIPILRKPFAHLPILAAFLAAAAVAGVSAAADMKDFAMEFDFQRIGVPRYPGMSFVGGTVHKQAETRIGVGGEGGTAKEKGPSAGMDVFIYTTSDTIEQAVAYYEKKLGQKAHWPEPKSLKDKFPFQQIPQTSKGRQATFVVRDPKGSRTDQDAASLLLGKAIIVISDFFKDPEKDVLVSKTTILFMEVKPGPGGVTQDVGPPPPIPAPWPPKLPIEPPPPMLPGGRKIE